MKKYANADAYFAESEGWRPESERLRALLLDCGLSEAIKWGKPCYLHDGHNIAILQKFKPFLALMFFKGALLDDPWGYLESQGEHTRSALRVTFTSVDDVVAREEAIRRYVAQAIEVEEAGLTVPKIERLELIEELQARLAADPALKAAFEALTPGRQRAYNLHFGSAKKPETRIRRIEQSAAKILAGKGLRDP